MIFSFYDHSKLRLFSRNEGKIKSYDSCRDVRAWSHDLRARDLYLREWMKADMPICVLPTGTLSRFMRTMTSRSRGRAAPRCHPDCKSKVVLDSICNSCHIMKSCLKNEQNFEKYFDDEEFETSHWPCERCLEALKSFKMFWKIIIEKIFNVSIPKDEVLDQKRCCSTDSVRSVAKLWQSEMTQQAMFVKNISYLNRPPHRLPIWEGRTVKKENNPCIDSSRLQDHKNNDIVESEGKADCRSGFTIKSFKAKSTDTDCLSNPMVNRSNRTGSSLNSRRHSRNSTAKGKMVDTGCNCNEICEEMNTQKTMLLNFQQKCTCQKQEIDKLRRENSCLRIELQNIYKNASWKSAFFTPSRCTCTRNSHDSIAILPKPFECYADDRGDTNQVKGVESEMIITMKNGKNENYGHISLLQVLHKTNSPNMRELSLGHTCSNKKEDPVELLTKVQNTFGAIVKREMVIANKNESDSKCDIDASFNKLNACKSAPSCSTTTLASSDSHFA